MMNMIALRIGSNGCEIRTGRRKDIEIRNLFVILYSFRFDTKQMVSILIRFVLSTT